MQLDLNQHDFPLIRTKAHLVENLRFVYGLIVASEDLIRLAAGLSGLSYFAGKALEEAGHAAWLLDDIVKMGEKIPPLDHDAACIAGAQFYYIQYVSPLMLLGYMSALETSPMPLEDVAKLESLYGKLPTLRYHAEHDIKHGHEVTAEIDKIRDGDLKQKIFYNERCTRAQIAGVMQNRFDRCDHGLQ